jgi:CRISPR-associated protein Cas5d
MKKYPVSLEVSAPLAMFARPDSGGVPTSAPVPTWSASKGLFEAIAMLSSGDAWIYPTSVEICRRKGGAGGIRYQRYTTNYGGPLRKAALVRSGDGMQVIAHVLSDVCYRLHGEVRSDISTGGQNPGHYLQDLFDRRVRRGQCFRTPAMGWREFTCDYWGVFRDEYEIDDTINIKIPSLVHSIWDRDHNGK